MSFITDLNVERGDREEEGGHEKIKIQASQILKCPIPMHTAIWNWECKDHFKECKATEMIMLISYICTCFTLCSFLYIISFVFHCKHSTGIDIPIWQIQILYPDRLRGLSWVPGQVYARAGTKTHYALILSSVLFHCMFFSLFSIDNSVEAQKLKNSWVFSAWNISPLRLLPLDFLILSPGKHTPK